MYSTNSVLGVGNWLLVVCDESRFNKVKEVARREPTNVQGANEDWQKKKLNTNENGYQK